MNRLSIFICEDSISFKPKNTFLTLDSQRPTIYQINGNFMRICKNGHEVLKTYMLRPRAKKGTSQVATPNVPFSTLGDSSQDTNDLCSRS